jgi:uncharacterized peroxidase-related enzyme
MSRILTSPVEFATGASAEVFARLKQSIGGVPKTYAVIGTLHPAALQVILDAESVLANGNLDRKDQETIKLTVSEAVGCDYCASAHDTLARRVGLKPETVTQIRAGEPTGEPKRDALVHFVRALIKTSGVVSVADFSAIKAAGYSSEQLVDISLAISLITFTNVFNRTNATDLDVSAR